MNNSTGTFQKIKESVAYINKHVATQPEAGVILGSGLDAFAGEVKTTVQIPYSDIPHFPVSGVSGHEGMLSFGKLGDTDLVIMRGRIHYYEGYAMDEVIYPVRVLKYVGVNTLYLSNAAGGMNENYRVGDIMFINDHINLMPNPLIGSHEPEFGERFPDMSVAYDPTLLSIARQFAAANNLPVHTGCYVGVSGPTYETPAEYRYMRIIGGDAVGMSTVPEVIAARQMGICCFAASVITDLGVQGKIEYLTHEMVKSAARAAEPRLAKIFRHLITSGE